MDRTNVLKARIDRDARQIADATATTVALPRALAAIVLGYATALPIGSVCALCDADVSKSDGSALKKRSKFGD